MTDSHARRSLAARRGHPYDKGRGLVAQVLWVVTSTLVFTQVWCPSRLRCVLLRWFGAEIGTGVLIKHKVNVQWPWKLAIGDNSWVGRRRGSLQPGGHPYRFRCLHIAIRLPVHR